MLVIYSIVTFVSLFSITLYAKARRKPLVDNTIQQLMNQYLNTYINAERQYEAMESELAVKSRFYQQTPAAVRGAYSDELIALQQQVKAQKAYYFEAKSNYLSLGKSLV